jgi:hypothetical protein
MLTPGSYFQGEMRLISDMTVLAAYNFTLDAIVHVSDFVVDNIPKGKPLSVPESS